jgi:hypothetical protein
MGTAGSGWAMWDHAFLSQNLPACATLPEPLSLSSTAHLVCLSGTCLPFSRTPRLDHRSEGSKPLPTITEMRILKMVLE